MQKKRKNVLVIIALVVFVVACSAEKKSTIKSLPSDVAKEDYKEIVTPNNNLGFELLPKVERNDDGNVFISPTSLLLALSMVYNGAEGKTKEEMANVLQLNQVEARFLNKASAALMNVLQKDTESVQLSIANSIWLNKNFHFHHKFAENNQLYFDAIIEEIDVQDNGSVDRINRWVSNATNQKIHKMVDAPLDPNLVTYLLNAIYFNGDWLYEFDEELTKTEVFHLQDGETTEVSMMSLTEDLRYMESDLFQAVELPYNQEKMRMNVFLPRENVSMEDFYQALTLNNWTEWQDEFETKTGTVTLPKFKMSYETELKESLQQLGMQRAFNEDAEFSKLIEEDDPVWISSVKQKTFIEVHEKGTEAAAVTGVEMVAVSKPVEEPFIIEMNRPFILTITDIESGAILFLGEVQKPVEEA